MEQNNLKYYRLTKVIQLILFILLSIFIFFYLLINQTLRNSIYTNPALFWLCTLLWITFLLTFLFLLYDFSKMRSMAVVNHQLNQAAYLDDLTGIPNRYSCNLIFQKYKTPESIKNVGCCVLSIGNLEEINSSKGHDVGDNMIQFFCNTLEEIGDQYGFVGRNGGNDFLVVIDQCTQEIMDDFLNTFTTRLNDDSHNTLHLIKLKHSYLLNTDAKINSFTELVSLVYKTKN